MFNKIYKFFLILLSISFHVSFLYALFINNDFVAYYFLAGCIFFIFLKLEIFEEKLN